MTYDPNVSPQLRKPLRDLCPCKRGPILAEVEMCQHCVDDAQANVTDLDSERQFREVERIIAGEDHG